ncbi:MAG: NAD(P)(+) transhydrogenase (Re/Si-specific) subunit beta [Phycisphaerae bacterium]|nr:NAD(P)(+) transhydrogenase (Re/Si-specific) subunit beta [Phycisphaerae bacterium]
MPNETDGMLAVETMSHLLIDIGVILVLILGISQFRTPRGARLGNLAAAFAMLCAMGLVLYRHSIAEIPLVVAGAGAGAVVGWLVAARVNMVGIPAMVAFQHGAGGVAALLVSAVELTRLTGHVLSPIEKVAAVLGLIIGAATFSGSMIASGKLANKLRQTPTLLPQHNLVLATIVALVLVLAVTAGLAGNRATLIGGVALLAVAAISLGIVFSIRIGGADMPVLISFLNATAGLAAALCGVVIGNRLLIACGATVAASGSILTHVMCRAMNRRLATVLTGIMPSAPVLPPPPVGAMPGASSDSSTRNDGTTPPSLPAMAKSEAGKEGASPVGHADPVAVIVEVMKQAQRVIIIPGYGMALADAQGEVVQLAEALVRMGKEVRFAIHPVAGRMPGHMHVLLAEAEVDYGMIRELNDINADFAETDLALVVGACDVVNPVAIQATGTPISGMPILRAHEARRIGVCNLDEKPGYSGVPNPLYRDPKTIMLLGDAKESVGRLLERLT